MEELLIVNRKPGRARSDNLAGQSLTDMPWAGNMVRAILTVCVAVGVLSSPALAQTNPEDTPAENTLETVRGIGMGTGARAGVIGTSALAYNPANLPLKQLYHIDALVGFVPGENAWSLGTAIADSASSKLAMGTSFRGVLGNGNRQYKGWDWRAGLGFQIANPISIGVGLRYAKLKAKKDDMDMPLGPRLKKFTMDAAIRLTPAPWLHIAGVGYNLIKTNSELAPRIVGGGLALTLVEQFELGGDFLVDLTTFEDPEFIIGGGLEYLAGGQAPLRVGYRHDTGREQHQITASLGYVSKQFGGEVGLRQDVGGLKETQLVFSLRFHVQ